MPLFKVTIRATITKTYEVKANNRDEAIEFAHEEFSVLPDEAREKYSQHFVAIAEVEAETN